MPEPNWKEKRGEITTDENCLEWLNLGKPTNLFDGLCVSSHDEVTIDGDQLTYEKIVAVLAEMDAIMPRQITRQRWFERTKFPLETETLPCGCVTFSGLPCLYHRP